MVHRDYHIKNLLMQQGELILIDMDTLCMGHPIFELASMFNAFVGFSDGNPGRSMEFLKFDYITAQKFWRDALSLYLDTTDENRLNEVEDKAKLVGYTRILRRTIKRESNTEFGQKQIALYKERIHELVQKVTDLNF